MYDVPLIYETRTEKRYDIILLAHCAKKIQKERVLIRDKITDTLFNKILESQLSFNDKLKYKPKIVDGKAVPVSGVLHRFTYILDDE